MFTALSTIYNPVLRAELQRMRRHLRPRRFRLLALPWYLLHYGAIFAAIFVIVFEIAYAIFRPDLSYIPESWQWPMSILTFILPAFVLIPITVVMHFRLILSTLTYSADSIAREKRIGSWEILLLTPIDARQIVLGKWWAVVRSLWRSYLHLVLLRVGCIIWIGLSVSRISGAVPPYFYINSYYGDPPTIMNFVLPMLVILVLTFANGGFSAAIGILASLLNKRSSVSMVIAIVLRLVVLIASIIAILWIGYRVFYSFWTYDTYSSNSYYDDSSIYMVLSIFQTAGGSLFDNGSSVASLLVTPVSVYLPSDSRISYLVGLLLALLYYVIAGGIVLRIAQFVAVRQNILPPDKHKKRKLYE